MGNTEHHIKTKLGGTEFEARGTPELVEKQYLAFLEAAKALISEAGSGILTESNEGDTPSADRSGAEIESPTSTEPVGVDGPMEQSLLDRIYHTDGNLVSLTALPSDKTDALLMLIYGNDVLGGMNKVTGATLMKGAKQSGLSVDRIDRFLNRRTDLVLSGGAKRGRRYHLNNQGKAYVKKLLDEMQ